MQTRWTEQAKNGETWTEYPRPSMVRNQWINLNGLWKYAFTNTDRKPDLFAGKIRVPFSPEAELSGVGRQLKPKEYLWYQRKIVLPALHEDRIWLLHFGAVDQRCKIWIDERQVAEHEGGYLPFTLSLKNLTKPEFVLTVQVQDDSDASYHARGKQRLKSGGMYYTAQSGIWQSVWMEEVPRQHIRNVCITPDAAMETVKLELTMSENWSESQKLKIRIRPETEADAARRDHPEAQDDRVIPESAWLKTEETSVFYYLDSCQIQMKFALPEPELWSPEHPFLYHLEIEAEQDLVEMYFAMRFLSSEPAGDGYLRFFLNGEPIIHTGVLDQGYWPDGLMTAPSDEALIFDIQTMKDLGFQMLRKHIKIEPQRWYYHCDRLGMLVWQDMVSGGSSYQDWFITYVATVMNIRHLPFWDGFGSRFLLSRTSRAGREEFRQETRETILRLYNHPSIVTWVPFNEGWGQFDAKKIAELVREMDPTRYIDHASGWFDQKAGDIVSLHHYFFGLHFKPEKERVLALTEYGGFTWKMPGHTWTEKLYGYGDCADRKELTDRYVEKHRQEVYPAVRKGVSALVYTQVSDVEEEANGLLTYDREEIKPDAETIRRVNRVLKDAVRYMELE